MQPLSMAGLALVLAGIAILAFGHFSYTTQEKVVDIGPVTATVDERHAVDIPDIAGLAAIAAGAAMLVMRRRTA